MIKLKITLYLHGISRLLLYELHFIHIIFCLIYTTKLTTLSYIQLSIAISNPPINTAMERRADCLNANWHNQLPAKLKTAIHSLDYNMDHKKRGFCLIFDNENFHPSRAMPTRTGTQTDSNGLYSLFRSLCFDVVLFRDLTSSQIKQQLKLYSAYDHTDNDCFACCVLTHGDHGHLYGYDSKFAIDSVFTYFLGNNCPTLVGKPKMFFIQACQGDRLDPGVPVMAGDATDAVSYFKIPTHADFLVAYSTLPGYYSWRNTQDGSWFMQSLIKVLQEYHQHLDLLSMMTIVSHQVAYNYSSNASSEAFNRKKQVPCITSMLTRRIYLTPKMIII